MAITKVSRGLLNTGVSDSSDGTAITIDSSENVGIGTTPASGVRLDIRNDSTTTIADLRNANSSGFGLYVAGGSSSSQYALRAADKDNNALFSVMSDGNVGIGITNPSDYYSEQLVVNAEEGEGGITIKSATNTTGYLMFADGTSGNTAYRGYLMYSHTDDEIRLYGSTLQSFYTNGGERMRITSSGNVGIGLTNPASKLHVRVGTNNNFEVEETGGDLRLLAINDARDANVPMEFAASQYDFLTGNATFSGSLSKGSGSFKIDHPLESKKDTHNLIHSFVEAPQADNIYRGVVSLENGSATINLDTVSGMTEGTYVLLNTNTQCFTTNETDWDAVKGSVTDNILTISCENTSSTATVSWLVIGERHDQHMIDTDWTDENGKVIVEPLKEAEE